MSERRDGASAGHPRTGAHEVAVAIDPVDARHRWPGNVCELKHVIEEVAVLATGGIISPEHINLPKDLTAGAVNPNNAVGEPPRRQSAKRWKVGGKSFRTRLVFQPAANLPCYSLASWRFICFFENERG